MFDNAFYNIQFSSVQFSPLGPHEPVGGDVAVCLWHKPTELARSFIFCSCVCFCLYGPFYCISFHNFSRQLSSAFSLCSSGLISALLVRSTAYLFMKVSFSPDIILRGWLGLKHQLTVPWLSWPSEGHEGRFSRNPLPVFSAGGPCEQFWHRQEYPLFDVVHPAFALPTTASSTLQGAMKNDLGEAVVACNMPEPCKFPFYWHAFSPP